MATPLSYYRPYYPSDSESDKSLSEYDSEGANTFSRPSTPRPTNALQDYIDPRTPSPDFAALAKALSQPPADAAGPSFTTTKANLAFAKERLDSRVTFSPYQPTTKADLATAIKDAKGTASGAPKEDKLKTASKDTQTVIQLQSRNRDRTIYPQPTSCMLLLPRIYRNITAFSIAQINLTSAFFYFRQDKFNVYLPIYEKDTFLLNDDGTKTLDLSGNPIPLNIVSKIRDGSYNINQLLTEIQIQLNTPPLFYDFINGFQDFLQQFQVNGDYSINFNYPGDYYYDAVRKIYIQNPTRAQIVSFYFQSQYANQFTYTVDEVRIAYYYPVLKELILDPQTDLSTIDFSETGLSEQDTINHLLYNFQGITDPIALTVIDNNDAALDHYRVRHTFRYTLVNKYVATFDPANNRVTIQSPSLNTSLVNLLNTQYAIYLAAQLNKYGLTQAQYNALSATNTQYLSILQSMYDYIQTNLAKYFAVNYGTYSRAFFANIDNSLLIRNGLDASGVAITYDPVLSSHPRDTSLLTDYQTSPPHYWTRMTNLGGTEAPHRNMGSPTQSYPQSSNFAYNIIGSNIDLTQPFIQSDGLVYTDYRRSAGDILTNVDAGKYTVFKFRSKYRQTLQVETLPRQTLYRYPLYNQTHSVLYPLSNLYDVSYCFIAPTVSTIHKITYDISYNSLYGWSNLSNTSTNFSYSYNESAALWGSKKEQINVSSSNGRYYKFQTPLPVGFSEKGSNVYTYPFNVTITSDDGSTPFPSDFYAFFYHDIAAFNADISGVRHESPYHYKERLFISANTLSNTYSFTAYANQEYFMIVRPVSTSPNSTQYKIVPWFPEGPSFSTLSYDTNFDPLQDPATMLSNFNVAKNNDPAFVRLPVLPSTLWKPDPTDAIVNKFTSVNPNTIGYDLSGVSNDLTDYIPFNAYNGSNPINPTAKIRADPTNNFIFQYNTPYDTVNQTYFNSDTQNSLLTSNAANVYTWKGSKTRQYKLLNYNATTFIQDQYPFRGYTSNDTSPYTTAYNISTTSNAPLFGYTYTGTRRTLYLDQGVTGFTFLPAAGTWAIDRVTFKTNFINPSKSVNGQIHIMGVFYTGEITALPTYSVKLSNAIAICLKTGETTYTSSNLNIGFDSALGTYYTFSNYPSLVTRSNVVVSGFNQISKQLIPDTNSYYSFIAFTIPGYDDHWDINTINISTLATQLSNAYPIRIQNLTGSPIAYPYANQAYPSLTFYDGQRTPTGQALVLSTSNGNSSPYGPPPGADESISQYEQSIPYINTNLMYLSPRNIITDPSGFTSWSNLPIQPSYIYANIPGKMLFQNGGAFVFTDYVFHTTVDRTTLPERTFTAKGLLAIQEIFPDHENTSLIAVSGSSSNYIFLGASNITPTLSQLRFKEYSNGIIQELSPNSNYTFSNSFFLQHFVWNNDNSWFITSYSPETNSIVLQGDTVHRSEEFNTMITYIYPNHQVSELQMDPSGTHVFLATATTPLTGFSTIRSYSLDPANTSTYIGSGNPNNCYTLNLQTGGILPPYYKQFAVTMNKSFAVTKNNSFEEILLINPVFTPTRFYKVKHYITTSTINTSNTHIEQSVESFVSPEGLPMIPKRIIGGSQGSKWCLFDSSPFLQGNRNDAYDAPVSFSVAWQIFFPTMKIELRRLTSDTSPMTDLTNLDYPEWPHSAMFAYNNYTKLVKDISSNGGQWGLESSGNFLVSDVSFNGFYFNSYAMNIPLQSNYGSSDSNNWYFVAIRGWVPTEQFQTLVRFYLPNRYDFGFVTLRDISNEVLYANTIPLEFNPSYRTALLRFNSNFTFSNQIFGSNPTQGYNGSNINSTSFGDFMGQYIKNYSTFLSNTSLLSTIQGNVKASMTGFITSSLKYILPASALTRQRFTDPLLFQLQWKSDLTSNYVGLDDEWGLGWNLGYKKADTNFATFHIADSFYIIQSDFIYLRLNPEFNINRMDAGGKENYSVTREPTGITNQYYCKLLLTSFGGNATTFIHNPITFNPPLYRLTKLEFQWIDANGNLISNDDSEWNMTVNITERMDLASIPDKMEMTQTSLLLARDHMLPEDDDAKSTSSGGSEADTESDFNGYLPATRTRGVNRDFPANLPAQIRAYQQSQSSKLQAPGLQAIAANTWQNQYTPLTPNSQDYSSYMASLSSTVV